MTKRLPVTADSDKVFFNAHSAIFVICGVRRARNIMIIDLYTIYF